MGRVRRIISIEGTEQIGRTLAKQTFPNQVVAIFGDLGAGKTTLARGFINQLSHAPQDVSSPTFVYLNVYMGSLPVYHFDLYRLSHEGQFIDMGFHDYFSAGGVCLIEWAERIESLLPEKAIRVFLSYIDETSRDIEIL